MKDDLQLDEVSMAEIWQVIWKGKFFIVATVFIFAISSVAFVLSLPNLYRSEVRLMSVGESATNLSSLAGNLGGLASLAGISLGGGGSGDKSILALEMLKSRKFLKSFVDKHDLLIPIIAAIGVDKNNKLIINEDLFDINKNEWVREVIAPKPIIPSAEDVFLKFKEIISVEQDSKNGTIRITFEFFKPELAQVWLSLLVSDINDAIRAIDMKEAEDSIEYLQATAESTPNTSMQQTFYQLIEEQTQTLLLTKVRSEYVFKTIDPATFPEEKSSPKRALICILVTVVGFVFSLMLVLIRHFAFKK